MNDLVGRKNGKEIIVDGSNSIKKSNELSMSKLNQGLTLTQMQLLGYCVYSTQQGNGRTFKKVDFEKTFGIDKYLTPRAAQDADKVSHLRIAASVDLEQDKFKYRNAFAEINYEKGEFDYEFTPRMMGYITGLEDNYLITDLAVVANFKSSFSWTLYEYLKANYGCWYKTLSKQAVMNLFGVEKKKSYQSNTGLLKKYVIDVAVEEINKYTELNINCESETSGRSITGFKFTWSTGATVQKATKKQMEVLKTMVDVVFEDAPIYNKIKDTGSREKVLTLVREVADIRDAYFDGDVGMSIDLYSTVLKQLTQAIEDLNLLLVKSSEEPYDIDVPMFDWLNN